MLKHIVARNHDGENLYKFDEIKEYFLKGMEDVEYIDELNAFINEIGKGINSLKYENLKKCQQVAVDLGINEVQDFDKTKGISDKQIDNIKQFIADKELKGFEKCPYSTIPEYDSSEYFKNIKSNPYFYLVRSRCEYLSDISDERNVHEIYFNEEEFVSKSGKFKKDYEECEKLLNKKLYYKDIQDMIFNSIFRDISVKEGTIKDVNSYFEDVRLPFLLKEFIVMSENDGDIDNYYRLYKLQ